MSNAARIRAWLAQHQPATMTQIWEGLGMKRETANTLVGEMLKSGYIDAGEGTKNRTYTLTGKQRAPVMSMEERRERNRARCAARRLAQGQIPRAVTRKATEERRRLDRDARQTLREQIRAEAQERMRLKEMAKAIRADNAKRRKEAAKAKPAKVTTTEHAAQDRREAARQVVSMRASAIASPPVAEDRPCTESWLRENAHDPAKYHVLKPGEWSSPLRFEY